MNLLFSIITIITFLFFLFTSPQTAIESMIAGSEKAVTLCFTLLAVYVVWLSILELVSKTRLDEKLSNLMRPIIRKLFGKNTQETEHQIAINLSSNMLGMGNASTPSGMRAMQGLDKKKGKLNKGMALLFMLNTTAIQIIPTTIIGLRTTYHSSNPSSILLPTLIATTCSTLVGVLFVILIEALKRKQK